jgi:predicted acetylornithine/succinylornithine family transaminase
MSISCAPQRIAISVSAALTGVAFAPSGNPATVHTFTGEPASSAAASGTQYGFTHTLAKPYWRASAHSCRISAAVASGLSSVWSMDRAMDAPTPVADFMQLGAFFILVGAVRAALNAGYHGCMEIAAVSPSVVDLEKQYLLQNYARLPLVLHRGRGCYVYDTVGKRYLDLIAGIGVNALGYAHPRLTKVIREQAGLLLHSSNLYYHEYQGPLAQRVAQASGLDRVFFSNSGTESMEGALKMARAHGRKINPEKYQIISLDNSFHGRTLGALSITGQEKYRVDFEPLLPGVSFVPRNDVAALERAASDRTAGIVLELVQGEGGIYPLTAEYIRKARALADRHNALLIFDEIQCGVGRPGTYFSYQLIDPPVLPDVMVAAKPLACGIPLGVIAANERAAASITSGMHGSTFGGGPLACRVALEFFDILDTLLTNIVEVGGYFRTRLTDLARRYSFIKEIRGYGLMIGVELDIPGKQIVLDAMEEGLLINCTHDVVLRALPPYILAEQDVDRAITVLNRVLKKAKPA